VQEGGGRDIFSISKLISLYPFSLWGGLYVFVFAYSNEREQEAKWVSPVGRKGAPALSCLDIVLRPLSFTPSSWKGGGTRVGGARVNLCFFIQANKKVKVKIQIRERVCVHAWEEMKGERREESIDISARVHAFERGNLCVEEGERGKRGRARRKRKSMSERHERRRKRAWEPHPQ
jgi:hypothetical protein